MKQKVLIVGAGEIGQAMRKVLQHNKNVAVDMWDLKKSLCTDSKVLKEAVLDKDFVFLCVPSHALETVAKDVASAIGKKTIVISLTKGLERKTGKFSSEILIKVFGINRIGILAGPMLAEELDMHLPTKATFGSKPKVFARAQKLFKNTPLTIEHCKDIKGVSIAGVIKNTYALALGIVEALQLGANAQGVIMAMAMEEMQLLIKRLGGKEKTALTLAGLGDLEATGHSNFSHNHSAGQEAVRSKTAKLTSEGALSMPLLLKRLGNQDLPPLLKATRAVVVQRKPAREIFLKLLK